MTIMTDAHYEKLDKLAVMLKESPVAPYIEDLILYGSCARGEACVDSDIDVMLVTSIPVCELLHDELLRLLTLCVEDSIDLHICSVDTFKNSTRAYYDIIRKEGISIRHYLS